jgi:hypothetical protein
MDKEVRKILLEAVNLERWAPKTDQTFPFLEDQEKEELIQRIVSHLKSKGYFINKIQAQ